MISSWMDSSLPNAYYAAMLRGTNGDSVGHRSEMSMFGDVFDWSNLVTVASNVMDCVSESWSLIISLSGVQERSEAAVCRVLTPGNASIALHLTECADL